MLQRDALPSLSSSYLADNPQRGRGILRPQRKPIAGRAVERRLIAIRQHCICQHTVCAGQQRKFFAPRTSKSRRVLKHGGQSFIEA
jgi:hypothetical protein